MTCQPEPARPFSATHFYLLGLLLLAATLISYGPVWRAGFIWDDDAYVTANPLLTAPDGLRRIWFSLDSPSQYFPLTYTTFLIERGLWGLNPMGFHIVNVLLHAVNAVLVWRVLSRLQVPGAWLAAAIFALHPVQVESVAWITERKNVLMGLFFLLTLLAWLRFVDSSGKRPVFFYCLALAFFALALFAKTTACVMPAALLLILWLKRIPITLRRVAQVAPFVAMGIVMGLLTIWWERHHQGTQGKLFEIGLIDRVLVAAHALWFYLGKLLWPVNLTFSYPHWIISSSDPFAYGWLIALVIAALIIWRIRRWTGRSVEVAALFFAATLGPVLGFIMLYTFLYSYVADHYQYLACIGPIALVAAGLKIAWTRVAGEKMRLEYLLAAALLVPLGVLTWNQCKIYADDETLWRVTLKRNPNSWLAYGNLGTCLSRRGQIADAAAYFEKATEINPDNPEAQRNLALAFLKEGRMDDAISRYKKAVDLEPGNSDIHVDLGNCFLQFGQNGDAIAEFRQALVLQSTNSQARNNLGNCWLRTGRFDDAIIEFQKALQLQPDFPEAENNLAACFYHQRKLAEAAKHYQKAIELRPEFEDARLNLASALLDAGKMSEGILQFRQALKIAPTDHRALNGLAWVLATCPEKSLRNGPEALSVAQKANELSGGKDPYTLHILAAAYAETGKFTDAAKSAQQALELAQAASQQQAVTQLSAELKRYKDGRTLY